MSKPKIIPIGACEAILSSVKTLKDGSFAITLEINPDDSEIISKLMRMYAENKRLFSLGIAYKND